MVTFVLQQRNDVFAAYNYYPENHKESEPGIITINLRDGNIKLEKVAEDDFLRTVSAAELNETKNSINAARIERGEPPLTEEELPTATSDEQWYYYADHAIRRLSEDFEQGKISERGTVAWY